MIRRIGRRCRDSSPVTEVVKGMRRQDRRPAFRIVLPELPASSLPEGTARAAKAAAANRVSERPVLSRPVSVIATPRTLQAGERRAAIRARRIARSVLVPSASAATKIEYRCEMDFVAWRRTAAFTQRVGVTVTLCVEAIAELYTGASAGGSDGARPPSAPCPILGVCMRRMLWTRVLIAWIAVLTFVAPAAPAQQTFTFFASLARHQRQSADTLTPADVRVSEGGADGTVLKVERVDWPVKVTVLNRQTVPVWARRCSRFGWERRGFSRRCRRAWRCRSLTTAPQPPLSRAPDEGPAGTPAGRRSDHAWIPGRRASRGAIEASNRIQRDETSHFR
jgi:hypothetical protein